MYAILVCYDEAQTRLEARTFPVVSMYFFASLFVLSLLIELQKSHQDAWVQCFRKQFSSVLKLGRVQSLYINISMLQQWKLLCDSVCGRLMKKTEKTNLNVSEQET
jgi:hypothetical protein